VIARHVVARLLETFFRRWWLYVLPIVLLVGLGVFTAGRKADTYRSTAVLRADETLIAELQDVARIDTLDFESPAGATARQINEALRTDDFVRLVSEGAGIPEDSLVVTFANIRRDVWASAEGQRLVSVNASTLDPQLAQRLVESTITTYTQAIVDSQVKDSEVTLELLAEQQAQYQTDLETATEDLRTYLIQNPEPLDGRTVLEQFEVDRLSGAVTRADDRLSKTADDIQAAELRREQATSEATQTLRVVDPASFPLAPTSGLRDVVFTVGTFAILGVLLMVGAVVGASLLDRSLRFAEEVRARLGVEVLAVVPVEPRSGRRRRRKVAA
jgi:uncharacterized protein involved in exopolysaccharide biosynthesis